MFVFLHLNQFFLAVVKEKHWMCFVLILHANTYHTLLAKAKELLDFLRHEHLCAANCISNQLKNWKEEEEEAYTVFRIPKWFTVHCSNPAPSVDLLSSGSSFSSASLSMFWHQPSILSTSVCSSRKKNSPSLMHGVARPESGKLRGPSSDGVPAQARSDVMGRGEWERGGKWGCWCGRGSAGHTSAV